MNITCNVSCELVQSHIVKEDTGWLEDGKMNGNMAIRGVSTMQRMLTALAKMADNGLQTYSQSTPISAAAMPKSGTTKSTG